jgi:predicted nucleotide-binding protein
VKKTKRYPGAYFSADVIREARDALAALKPPSEKWVVTQRTVTTEDSCWSYDSDEEFLAEYRKAFSTAWCAWHTGTLGLTVAVDAWRTKVDIEGATRMAIEGVFDVFERHVAASTPPPPPAEAPSPPSPTVFVGHGHSTAWRDVKDHLQDKHGIRVIAYETGARAGHTIRDILEEMAKEASFAILILTGEDTQADGSVHARSNVIHETGLFQGRLGFSRAIVLLEEGVTEFSNIHGIHQIRFASDRIRETFGEILATLRREFGAI